MFFFHPHPQMSWSTSVIRVPERPRIICANDRFLAGHGRSHYNVTKQTHACYLFLCMFTSSTAPRGRADVKHATITWWDQTPVENAKCWLSLWHGEVRGPFPPAECSHVTFLLFKQSLFAPSPLISPLLLPFLRPSPPLMPSYLIQQCVEL